MKPRRDRLCCACSRLQGYVFEGRVDSPVLLGTGIPPSTRPVPRNARRAVALCTAAMVWIRGTKGSARCLERLVKCLLALTGSGHVSSAVAGGRGAVSESTHKPTGGDRGNAKPPIGSAFVQPWRSSCSKLAWSDESNRNQGGSRGLAVGARLRDPRRGHISNGNNMVQDLLNPVSYLYCAININYCTAVNTALSTVHRMRVCRTAQ